MPTPPAKPRGNDRARRTERPKTQASSVEIRSTHVPEFQIAEKDEREKLNADAPGDFDCASLSKAVSDISIATEI